MHTRPQCTSSRLGCGESGIISYVQQSPHSNYPHYSPYFARLSCAEIKKPCHFLYIVVMPFQMNKMMLAFIITEDHIDMIMSYCQYYMRHHSIGLWYDIRKRILVYYRRSYTVTMTTLSLTCERSHAHSDYRWSWVHRRQSRCRTLARWVSSHPLR